MRWLIVATLVVVLLPATVRGADPPREQIGEVLGKPVYRDQLRSTEGHALRNELHRLFTAPAWNQYKEKNKAKIKPTKAEIKALLGHLNKRRDQQRPKLEARLAEVKQELAAGELAADARRKLEVERAALKVRIKPLEPPFAVWWLSHWKTQRLLYDQYGGGRVIWQQVGLEALDAMHAWLREQETIKSFRVTDPALRRTLFEYWTTTRHMALKEDQVKSQFLHPEWLPRKQATPSKK